MDFRALQSRLQEFGQQHLLSFWSELDETQRHRLEDQIGQVDLPLVQSLVRGEERLPDWDELARRAVAPQAIQLDRPATIAPDEARSCGVAALRAGRVGMILVAGGQGTRLGFDQPKGMLPLAPISKRTLLQILIDRLRAVAARYSVHIPLYLMTSPATHAPTTAYFAEHGNLGFPADDLHVFCQGVMPAVDAGSGQILLAGRDRLALSPDGHGGMLAALHRSGCLSDARSRGIEILFYGQVDNPLLQVCDAYFLGCHLLARSEMTTQVVRKRDPHERVGNVVEVDGRTRIIEYSDLPEAAAQRRDSRGELELWAGNLAVHAFDLAFLERAVAQSDALPFHRARKKVAHLDSRGQLVHPQTPNAIKFERFIFDLLPAASRSLVVEVAKTAAFAPVKNADGSASDTPELARQAMIRHDIGLLEAAGMRVAEGAEIEVHPLWALDAQEAAGKLDPGTRVDQTTYFAPGWTGAAARPED